MEVIMNDELLEESTATEEEPTVEETTEDESPELEEERGDDLPEEEDPSTKGDTTLSKEERAIIKYKKENKELLNKLAELEKRQLDHRLERQEQSRIEELVEKGQTRDEALSIASREREDERERYELNAMWIKSLEAKCPSITLYTNELIELKKKYSDFSYEELYRLKFSKETAYDQKTRYEALARTKREEVEDRVLAGAKETKPVRFELSPEDERAYQVWRRYHPNGTRKEFHRRIYE